MIFIILLTILCALVAIGIIPAVVYYDKIVKYIYEFRQDIWVEVGSPSGILRKVTLPSGILEGSSQISVIKLFFATPKSISSEESLKPLVNKFKIHFVIWIVGAVLWFCLMCIVL